MLLSRCGLCICGLLDSQCLTVSQPTSWPYLLFISTVVHCHLRRSFLKDNVGAETVSDDLKNLASTILEKAEASSSSKAAVSSPPGIADAKAWISKFKAQQEQTTAAEAPTAAPAAAVAAAPAAPAAAAVNTAPVETTTTTSAAVEAPKPVAATATAPVAASNGNGAAAAPTTPDNVADARAWIANWRAGEATAAPSEATAASAAGVNGNGATATPDNVADARAWIANWRAKVAVRSESIGNGEETATAEAKQTVSALR